MLSEMDKSPFLSVSSSYNGYCLLLSKVYIFSSMIWLLLKLTDSVPVSLVSSSEQEEKKLSDKMPINSIKKVRFIIVSFNGLKFHVLVSQIYIICRLKHIRTKVIWL